MITTSQPPHRSTLHPARPFRLALFILIPIFIACLIVAQHDAKRAPTLGITVTQTELGGPWLVSNVSFGSRANYLGIEPGNQIVRIDGNAVQRDQAPDPVLIQQATQLVITNADGSKTRTFDLAGLQSGPLNLTPYLVMSTIFFTVGFITLLFGQGAAPRALALLTMSGALEAVAIPLSLRATNWAIIANGVCVPIFIGSFAYLFLVFPRRRLLHVGKKRFPPELILLPIIPTFITYMFSIATSHAAVIMVGRVLGYPYFLACFIGGILALILSWRQARPGREKTQLRTVTLASIAAITPFLLINFFPQITFGNTFLSADYTILPMALIPLAFGYAILRYQLMNMHLYLRRGVGYSILGVGITGVYTLGLAIASITIRNQTASSLLITAIMMTIVVLLGDHLRTKIQHHVDHLFDRKGYDYRRQLLEFSQQMNTILDPDELAESTVGLIEQTMSSYYVRLYIYDRATSTFHLWAHAGTPVPSTEQTLPPEHPTSMKMRNAGWEIVQHLEVQADQDVLLVPLTNKGQPVAMLVLGAKRSELPYSSEDLVLLSTVASQLAISTENAQLYGRMRDLYLSGIRTLAATVDAKDSYTHGHSERVAGYARALAIALNLPQIEVETIELAGLLHDIGKIGIPDAVLQKPGKLAPDERALIEQHTEIGARILADNPALQALVPLVRHHHERWDGKGYPDQLRGEAIPLGAAIICVADTFDTMTTNRPYRQAPGYEQAYLEILRQRGQQFSPRVVEAFIRVDFSQGNCSTANQKTTALQSRMALAEQATATNNRAMRIVYQIAQLLSTAKELDVFLQRVIELLQNELATNTVDFFIIDEETQTLYNRPSTQSSLGQIQLPLGQGLVGWVAQHQTAVCIDDIRTDDRAVIANGWDGRAELAVPLISSGKTIGVLNVESTRVAAFTDEDTKLLTIIAGQLAQVIEVTQLHLDARKAAGLDSLTKIANHRQFYNRLEMAIAATQQHHSALALAIIDVDNLKYINDTFGHLAGDSVLYTLAQHLEAHAQAEEFVARYGGDEFAIIFPNTTDTQAKARIEALRVYLQEAATLTIDNQQLPLPELSVGVAAFDPETMTLSALINAADKKMYEQKRAHRKHRQRPTPPASPLAITTPIAYDR